VPEVEQIGTDMTSNTAGLAPQTRDSAVGLAPQTQGSAVGSAVGPATAKRSIWNETSLSILRNLFHSKIGEGLTSMHVVKTKIKDNEVLSGIGNRKVYDRIRSKICRMRDKSETTLHMYCKYIRPQVVSGQNSSDELFLSWLGADLPQKMSVCC